MKRKRKRKFGKRKECPLVVVAVLLKVGVGVKVRDIVVLKLQNKATEMMLNGKEATAAIKVAKVNNN